MADAQQVEGAASGVNQIIARSLSYSRWLPIQNHAMVSPFRQPKARKSSEMRTDQRPGRISLN